MYAQLTYFDGPRTPQKAIMSTELLPGENPALLPGPDRIELYPVIGFLEAGSGSEEESEKEQETARDGN